MTLWAGPTSYVSLTVALASPERDEGKLPALITGREAHLSTLRGCNEGTLARYTYMRTNLIQEYVEAEIEVRKASDRLRVLRTSLTPQEQDAGLAEAIRRYLALKVEEEKAAKTEDPGGV